MAASIGSVAVALLAGWGVPALAMKMLWPALGDKDRAVRNYRGARISPGLGLAWLLWAVSVYVVVVPVTMLRGVLVNTGLGQEFAAASEVWQLWPSAALLVGGAFVFGLVDDVYGTTDARGFRGHLREMAKGRLTTGGLKLLGIGVVSSVAAVAARSLIDAEPGAARVVGPLGWVLATLVIALAANLVNLADLRPGRALKTYIALAAIGIGAATVRAAITRGAVLLVGDVPWLSAVVAVVLILGPVFAIWRYDLGEKGMLGDAGANAMGALAGYLLASSLPLWGLAFAAAVLLALNLASEKVSFSEVIERNGFLRWLDGIGRLGEEGAKPAPATARDGGEEHAESRKDGGAS